MKHNDTMCNRYTSGSHQNGSGDKSITSRKHTESIINQQNIELKKLNTDKDIFISILGHDLRSPFNSILGLTQLLNDEFDSFSTDEKKTTILKLKEASETAYDLLENHRCRYS